MSLCETAPIDEDGERIARGPFAAGDVPNIQTARHVRPRSNEGQTVLTNGMNVGGRAGTPAAPGALGRRRARRSTSQAGQGLRLQIVNAATIRFFRLRLTDSAGTQIPLVRVGGEGGLLDDAVVEGGVDRPASTSSTPPARSCSTRATAPTSSPRSRPRATGVADALDAGLRAHRAMGFANIPTVPVAHFNVTGVGRRRRTRSPPARRCAPRPATSVETLGAATGDAARPGARSRRPSRAWPSPGHPAHDSAAATLGINGVHGDPRLRRRLHGGRPRRLDALRASSATRSS